MASGMADRRDEMIRDGIVDYVNVDRTRKLLANASERVAVHSVFVSGNKNTESDIIVHELQALEDVETLQDLTRAADAAVRRLNSFGTFRAVHVYLEEALDQPQSGVTLTNVYVQVEEGNRVSLTTGTSVGNNEGSVDLAFAFNNLFGRAEKLESNLSFGTRTSSSFRLGVRKPLLLGRDARVDVEGFKYVLNYLSHSSHNETVRGGHVTWHGLRPGPLASMHSVSYQTAWREVSRLPSRASASVRQQAGHSVKSSISHTMLHDRFNFSMLPTSGYAFRFNHELAGVGGDVRFYKPELAAQACIPLGSGGAAITMAAAAGVVVPLAARETSRINDRLFLGGSTSLRGFTTRSVGPRDGSDALGGDMSVSAFANIAVPAIPQPYGDATLGHILKLHAFVNVGSCVALADTSSGSGVLPRLSSTAHDVGRSLRASVGVGVLLRTNFGRIEVNYAFPQISCPGDQTKGLQIGVSTGFF